MPLVLESEANFETSKEPGEGFVIAFAS